MAAWAHSWLKALGVDGRPLRRGHEFDNYLILVQAALDGQGVALGGGRLADDFLAGGSLVRPLDVTLSSERGFYLLIPKDVPLGKSAGLFRDWILAEAKGGSP